jgi:hypothetical protein
LEHIFCSFSIKNEIWYNSVGRVWGKYENTEVTKKGIETDNWIKIR